MTIRELTRRDLLRFAGIGAAAVARDSDTIAGRAAMLAGTLHGAGNVPAEWIAMFGAPALHRIDGNAEALARLLAGPKADRMRHRQKATT